MKDIFSRIVAVLFTLFVVGVLAFLTYTAYSSISRVTDDDLLRYGTLIFFDLGALIWFGVFMANAKGIWQRAIAGLGFALGFLGTLALMASDIILGQTNVNYNPAQIYMLILGVVIGAAAGHAALIYAFKATEPKNISQIEDETFEQKQEEKAREAKKLMRKQIDAIQDLSIQKAQANLQQQANDLAGYLSQNYEQIAKQELLTMNLLANRRPEVIDAQATDADPAHALPAPGPQKSGLRWPWQKQQAQPPAPAQGLAAPALDVNALAAALAAALATQNTGARTYHSETGAADPGSQNPT